MDAVQSYHHRGLPESFSDFATLCLSDWAMVQLVAREMANERSKYPKNSLLGQMKHTELLLPSHLDL